jgi:hypothetical protein
MFQFRTHFEVYNNMVGCPIQDMDRSVACISFFAAYPPFIASIEASQQALILLIVPILKSVVQPWQVFSQRASAHCFLISMKRRGAQEHH